LAKKKEGTNNKTVLKNRKARFEYALDESFTAGLVLTGPEMKSVRAGQVNFTDAYCYLDNGIAKVRGLRIAEFKNAGYAPQDPDRVKLLLLKKTELRKIQGKLKDQGVTLVPTELFINEKGYAKLNFSVAKGKKLHDKRESIKDKDVQREIDRYV
jgi:SsrA-binding protein